MSAVIQLPYDGPFTWADLEAMPDDGRRYELIDRGLLHAPLLAVEVLSPGNRGTDLVSERDRYESSGCPSYWIIDPDIPSLLALELRDGRYVEAAAVKADEPFHATSPYPVTFTPSALVA